MYANTYFKTQDHDFENYFNIIDNNDRIHELKKALNEINKKTAEIQQEYTSEISKNYSKDFISVPYDIIINYSSKNYMEFYFDLYTGLPYDMNTEKTNIVVETSTKSFERTFVVGYSFPLGSVICRKYKCRINSDNSKMSTTIIDEFIVPMFENTYAVVHNTTNKNYESTKHASYYYRDTLDSVNASFFYSMFYGEKINLNINLGTARRYYLENPSFEIIIRTCKDPTCISLLLNKKTEKAIPIHQILKIKKEELKYLEEKNILKDYIVLDNFIEETLKDKFTKTPKEKIELIEKFKGYEEDLDFYHISYSKPLIISMLRAYFGTEWNQYKNFANYYKFSDFSHYIITEIVNQGYTSLGNITKVLGDYFSMCEHMEIKPVLYSSYIKQTHDIASRNYEIKLTEEQEAMLKERYGDFKTYIGNDYVVVAPNDSYDIKEEGNVLNHCVASYIKRIIDGISLIYFLRSKDDIESRLVTVEVRDGIVTEARGAHNRKITPNERKALEKFCKKMDYTMLS